MKRNASYLMALGAVLAVPLLLLLAGHRFAGGTGGLKPGDALPESGLVGLDGRYVDTKSWRGTPTLLVLYRSTCDACRQEIDGLAHIAAALPKVRIVLLSLDSAAPRVTTGFQILSDPSGQFIRKMRKLVVPTVYLVNGEGGIVYVRTGRRSPQVELAILGQLLDMGRI